MMRQKLLKIFVVLSMMLVPSVKAACTYKEQADLNKEVANIKVVYEETVEKLDASEYPEQDEDEMAMVEMVINRMKEVIKCFIMGTR